MAAARPAGARAGRADRPRGDGRGRRAGDAAADRPAPRAVGATGRDPAYGPLMFRLEDRKETGFCLSPTAEEVITSIVGGEYSSYRDLPGEPLPDQLEVPRRAAPALRPAARARVPHEGRVLLPRRRRRAAAAPTRTCTTRTTASSTRCGLTFRPVEAQAGEIGGDVNHEFMAVAAVGEDDFVWCTSCDYAANVEAARAAQPSCTPRRRRSTRPRTERVHTPDLPGIAGVAEHLVSTPSSC